MTMSRHWVRNKETDALERNSSSHGIPARSDIMSLEVKKKKKKKKKKKRNQQKKIFLFSNQTLVQERNSPHLQHILPH